VENNDIYRVSQEERTIFWEVIISVIPSKKKLEALGKHK
jgi:hypothetical protein